MNANALCEAALAELRRIAPEVEAIDPARRLRDQVDLDSMDWLNFLVALHERFGVDIPESEYASLDTLDAIVACLAARGAKVPG